MGAASNGLLIVSHGSPSAPDRPEAVMRDLAANVAVHLPGWSVRSATLAGHGTLKTAVESLEGLRFAVYPHFMADGWFVSEELPRRLASSGGGGAAILPPFGLDPALPALCLRRALAAAAARDFTPSETTLLLAAHGSPSDPRPSAAARAVAETMGAARAFAEIRIGYVDEVPYLADAARVDGSAICLPLFAGRAGHVDNDLPEALTEANFQGPMLDPIGTDHEVPNIIAASAARAADRFAA